MSLPQIVKDIDDRVLDIGDIMTGNLIFFLEDETFNIGLDHISKHGFFTYHSKNNDNNIAGFLLREDGPYATFSTDRGQSWSIYNLLHSGNVENKLNDKFIKKYYDINMWHCHGIFYGNVYDEVVPGNYWGNGGLEIREANLVSDTQSDFKYAPRLGFHWSGRIAGSISMDSAGTFYFRAQTDNDRAIIDADLIRPRIWGAGANHDPVVYIESSTTTSTTNDSWSYILSTISPYLNNGQRVCNVLGKNYGLNNCLCETFYFEADGSINNQLIYHWYGIGDRQCFYSNGTISTLGEYISRGLHNSICQFRAISGDYGFMIRNDGESTWFLITAARNQYGQWQDYSVGHPLRIQHSTGYVYSSRLYGSVWNDYAEFRKAESIEPGRVVIEDKSGEMKLSTNRMQAGAQIISDTYGFAIGETDESKTPIAVAGRVLVYTNEDRDTYPLGSAVCSGPNGTVSLMTREEIKEYPERIIGTVSEIPNYEYWGKANIKVNNRIWVIV